MAASATTSTTRPTTAYARVFPFCSEGERGKEAVSNDGMWGGESRLRTGRRPRLRESRAAGLGFVGFDQLSGTGARDFGVRLFTAWQGGPPALFHQFLLPPRTGFLELCQFDGGIGLRHE